MDRARAGYGRSTSAGTVKIHQWEIWKSKPPGLQQYHWFVILSNQERCDDPTQLVLNGLACWTLRGPMRKSTIGLDAADGFSAPTVVQCDYIYGGLEKLKLHSVLGMVSWERQQQIKSKLKEVLRLY